MSKKLARTPIPVLLVFATIGIICIISSILLAGMILGVLKFDNDTTKYIVWTAAVTGTSIFASTIPAWMKIGPMEASWMWSGMAMAGLMPALIALKQILYSYGFGTWNSLLYVAIVAISSAGYCLSKATAEFDAKLASINTSA